MSLLAMKIIGPLESAGRATEVVLETGFGSEIDREKRERQTDRQREREKERSAP